MPLTASYYSSHYAPIQREKYAQLWPQIKDFFPPNKANTLLDVGIGPAWFEEFLAEKGLHIPRVVGVDISEEAVAPRKKGIDYVLGPHFDTVENFDIVVCFDAFHCAPKMDLKKWVKPGGLVIVSEPRPFAHLLDAFSSNALIDEWVGEIEKSRVIVWKMGRH